MVLFRPMEDKFGCKFTHYLLIAQILGRKSSDEARFPLLSFFLLVSIVGVDVTRIEMDSKMRCYEVERYLLMAFQQSFRLKFYVKTRAKRASSVSFRL